MGLLHEVQLRVEEVIEITSFRIAVDRLVGALLEGPGGMFRPKRFAAPRRAGRRPDAVAAPVVIKSVAGLLANHAQKNSSARAHSGSRYSSRADPKPRLGHMAIGGEDLAECPPVLSKRGEELHGRR